MRKIILLVLLLPFLTFSQRTSFTDEEIQYVKEFYKKMENTDTSSDVYSREVEKALEKVPYYPDLVASLLASKLETSNAKFAADYCNGLDDNYLSFFNILMEDMCACSYVVNGDFSILKKRLPLIKDENAKALFLTAYYRGVEDGNEFIIQSKQSLNENYKHERQTMLRNFLFDELIFLFYNNEMPLFIKDYESLIFSSNLSIPISYMLMKSMFWNGESETAERFIEYVKKQDPENDKYFYPVSAWIYSQHDKMQLAQDNLEKALELKIEDFNKIVDNGGYDVDIFKYYSLTIRKIKNPIEKERLIEKAITYFKDKEYYRIRFELFKSLLSASNHDKEVNTILNEWKPLLNEASFQDFERMVKIESELGKKNPDYRLVNDIMKENEKKFNNPAAGFQRILYQQSVNYNTKKTIFSINEIVEDIDRLLEYPASDNVKMSAIQVKIALIAEIDIEWAMREFEKLTPNQADKIVTDFNSFEIDPEKFSQRLISNNKILSDISDSINLLNVSNITILELKK